MNHRNYGDSLVNKDSIESCSQESCNLSCKMFSFWCVLYTDPKTSGEYPDINVASYQRNIMKKIVGFNSLLSYPKELMDVIVTLESALNLLKSSEYTFPEYRKLILDAGATAGKLMVGGDADGCI